jgi:SAM-dependent methyltransferase
MLDILNHKTDILDLGCGNGQLAYELMKRGYRGEYTGLDFSENLLEKARERVAGSENFHFIQANLAEGGWQKNLSIVESRKNQTELKKDPGENALISSQTERAAPKSLFTTILAFAALHHIPGWENRLHVMRTIRDLLRANGRFIHSNWQFLNSERLRNRIHQWGEIGIKNSEVDAGDYLLDWRRGGFGLRYVHHFSEKELSNLAAESGFRAVESFYSDGVTGDLGLYQIWEVKH